VGEVRQALLGKDRELIFENLPLQLNLGPMSVRDTMGWAKGYKDLETRKTIIEITLNDEAVQALGDLTEVYELYALGFAGIRRDRPTTGHQEGGE
jgi:hypothetical protein